MTLMLELTPEMERQIQQASAQQGQSPEAYALALIQSALPLHEQSTKATQSPEERAREFQAWADSHRNMDAPVIPLEALSRGHLYKD